MRCLIIGGGAAGINTARLLRTRDEKLEIDVYTEENHPYYSRIRLIEYLAGEVTAEKLVMYQPAWYEQRNIQVHHIRVDGVDGIQRCIRLANGETVMFDKLVIAAGAIPFIPPIPNIRGTGVFALRTLDDAQNIRQYAKSVHGAFVLGGGLLGLEAARSLTRLGLKVTVLESGSRLLPRQLDTRGGELLQEIMREMGIKVVLGAALSEVLGDGTVAGIRLSDGQELSGQLLLVSAGVRPSVEFLADSGIVLNRGVIVDDRMETNLPGVFALGDIAEWRGNIWGIVPPILDQAPIVAENVLNGDARYGGTVPANSLKVAGVDLGVYGEAQSEHRGCTLLHAENPETRCYLKLVLEDDCLVGAIALGNKTIQNRLARMVQQRQRLDAAEAQRLLDEAVRPK